MPVEEKKPSLEGLTLLYLRSKRRWSQKELAARLGLADPKQISRYETGENPLRREQLDICVAPLGYPPEAVDALLFIGGLIVSEAAEEPASPVALTPEDRRGVDRAALAAAWMMVDDLREELRREKRRRKAEAARQEAQELWARMKSATRQERRELVTVFPEFRNWALAERVCEASVRAAAHKPEEALDLANLALFIAGRVPGDESWRSRLEGYCWAHVGNARRVANDFAGADKAFARAWDLWKAGALSDPNLLPEWRLLDLEASLRRAERRFSEALALLDRARVAAGDSDPVTIARILLIKEHVFDQMGEIRSALVTLAEAKPFVEISGDPRLLFALHFNTADNLCHLGQYREAAERLTQVRELAIRQSNELDLVRVVWLEARVAAGQGRREQAIAGLEQVRQDFTGRELPYDAALVSLDLAVLWLEVGCTAKVREMVGAIAWIFRAQKISREAVAALILFRDAAERETATVGLAQQVITEIKRARRSASPQA
jgi:transcriptional regulator with XRE-family HTH domain